MADPPALNPRQPNQAPQRFTTEFSAYRGPLPPPEMLAQYNQVLPRGAERILTMAESQQAHRQALETAVVQNNISSERRGQMYAFTLGLVAILGGIVLIAFDKDAVGIASIITAFTALAGIFVYGRKQQQREREQKRRDLAEAEAQRRLPYEE